MPSPNEKSDEKVAVRRIRIVNRGARTTAVVASFFTVDRVLHEWLRGAGGKMLDCDFEIFYDDGVVLSGQYRFQRKNGRRPALMRFICKHLAASCEEGTPAAGFPLHGLTAAPGLFLAHYETEDFARLHEPSV